MFPINSHRVAATKDGECDTSIMLHAAYSGVLWIKSGRSNGTRFKPARFTHPVSELSCIPCAIAAHVLLESDLEEPVGRRRAARARLEPPLRPIQRNDP